MEEQNKKEVIDLVLVAKTIWAKKKYFFIVWPIVIILSALWVFPKPRFYDCSVVLAPEGASEDASGLMGLASSFGFNLGSMQNNDAIYPMLYPDLFESTEFIVGLFDIKIETYDGSVKTDYYTYLKEHQQKNWLTEPFDKFKENIKNSLTTKEPERKSSASTDKKIDPFLLSEKDNNIVEKIKENITCDIDKKTNVITIAVKDQDRLVCALLADSIKERLQRYIIEYRTKKVRQDEQYYKHLTDSAFMVYQKAVANYGAYQDSHRNVVLQSYVEEGERLRNDVNTKQAAYNTFNTQYQAMKAKVQERTPSFTTLKSATVPQKPTGPKRMLFVIGMLILFTLLTCLWIIRHTIINSDK